VRTEIDKLYLDINLAVGTPNRCTALSLKERKLPKIPCSKCGTYDYISYCIENDRLICNKCFGFNE